MRWRKLWKILIIAGGGPLVGVTWLRGVGPKPSLPSPSFSSWAVYWDDINAERSFTAHGRDLEEVAVFAYHFDTSGNLIPGNNRLIPLTRWIQEHLPEPRPRTLLTLVNDIALSSGSLRLKDAVCVHQAITAPAARAEHIRQILALSEGVDGIDVDYERIDMADREAFSVFIQELGTALHARKKWLSVVVEPRPGAIDWAAILPFVDRIKVMAYLYHYGSSAPGSIAPTSWVSELAENSLKIIPPDKLCMVLHLGGFDWPEGTPGRSIEYSQAAMLASVHDETFHKDADTGSAYFDYSDKNVLHHVWIEEASGLKLKIQALQKLGIVHVGFWRLGTGDPALWESQVPISL